MHIKWRRVLCRRLPNSRSINKYQYMVISATGHLLPSSHHGLVDTNKTRVCIAIRIRVSKFGKSDTDAETRTTAILGPSSAGIIDSVKGTATELATCTHL